MTASTLLHIVAILLTLMIAECSLFIEQIGPNIVSKDGISAIINTFKSYQNISINPNENEPTNQSINQSVKIAFLLTLSGADTYNIQRDQGIRDVIQFMVDLINVRGGISINQSPNQSVNQQKYPLIAYVVDIQSSSVLAQMAVNRLIDEYDVHIISLPIVEKIAQSIVSQSMNLNVSFVTGVAYNPATYQTGAKNLFGLSITASSMFTSTLSIINQQAKSFALTNPGPLSATGYVSSFGISTMCIFVEKDDSFDEASSQSIKNWVIAENVNRSINGALEKDLVSAHWFITQPRISIDQYIQVYQQCPDLTDLVAVSMNPTTMESLTLSNRRFKSIISIHSEFENERLSDTSDLVSIIGWSVTIPVPRSQSSTLPGLFSTYTEIIQQYFVYSSATPGLIGFPSAWFVARCAEFEVMVAALNVSLSVYPNDFRPAVLSLNGKSTFLGQISINQSTGENQPAEVTTTLVQYSPSGGLLGISEVGELVGATPIYPFPFIWLPPVGGDELITTQSFRPFIAGMIAAVIASWIAQLLFQHAVLIREIHGRKNCRYLVWVLLSCIAFSLAICNVQAARALAIRIFEPSPSSRAVNQPINQSINLSINKPTNQSLKPLDIEWSLGMLMCSWITAGTFTFASLIILVHPTSDSRISPKLPSNRSIDQPVNRSSMQAINRSSIQPINRSTSQHKPGHRRSMSSAANRKAMLSRFQQARAGHYPTEFVMLARLGISFRCALSGWLLSLAITSPRFLVQQSLRSTVSVSNPHSWWIFSLVLLGVFLPFVAAAWRDSIKLRTGVVFVFAGFVLIDTQVGAGTSVVVFDPSPAWMNGGLLYDTSLTSDELSLILSVVSVTLSLMLVIIQYFNMRLSHAGLLAATTKTQKMLEKANFRVQAVEKSARDKLELVGMQTKAHKEAETAYYSLIHIMHRRTARINNMKSAIDAQFLVSNCPYDFVLPLSLYGLLDNVLDVDDNDDGDSLTQQANQNERERRAACEAKIIGTLRAHAHARSNLRQLDLSRPMVHHQWSDESSINQSSDQLTVVPVRELTLREILSHPSCVELFRQHIGSVTGKPSASLGFCMLVRRYRTLRTKRLRHLIAAEIVRVYLKEGANHPVSISLAQRHAIVQAVAKDGQSPAFDIFDAAERDVVNMMEVTSYLAFAQTTLYRLCCWLYASLDASSVTPEWLVNKEH